MFLRHSSAGCWLKFADSLRRESETTERNWVLWSKSSHCSNLLQSCTTVLGSGFKTRAMRCLWLISLDAPRSVVTGITRNTTSLFRLNVVQLKTVLQNRLPMKTHSYTLWVCVCSITWTHGFLLCSHYVIKLLQSKDKPVFSLDSRLTDHILQAWT